MYILSDNIISPLGYTTAQNFKAVEAGRSALERRERDDLSPEPYVAARFSEAQWGELAIEGLSHFEALAVRSVVDAISTTGIDIAGPDVVFILSTTKANIENLRTGCEPDDCFAPNMAAKRIAKHLGFATQPLVVCNACISGVAALITAHRLIADGAYKYAVVCGADVLSRFTLSGFQSLKALSAQECRPFDIERIGLNLGEAAATMVLTAEPTEFSIVKGAICNDAFHISSPSKSGEGAFLALKAIGADKVRDRLAFINAHGTATMYNDQMEAIALERAGLNDVPTNALKGFFGHTMGAAGILETIVSTRALEGSTVLATRGYAETGTSACLNLSPENRPAGNEAFVKMISGFGGGNAAILVAKTTAHLEESIAEEDFTSVQTHSILIDSQRATLDGQQFRTTATGKSLLVDLYKTFIADYPKFYKMDPLCRLGFVASELLLRAAASTVDAIILFNHSSSTVADRNYWATVSNHADSFPSPAHFVYTLPNIVTGEIAMRNNIHGETAFYIINEHDSSIKESILHSFAHASAATSFLTGWIDYPDDETFVAQLSVIRKSNKETTNIS